MVGFLGMTWNSSWSLTPRLLFPTADRQGSSRSSSNWSKYHESTTTMTKAKTSTCSLFNLGGTKYAAQTLTITRTHTHTRTQRIRQLGYFFPYFPFLVIFVVVIFCMADISSVVNFYIKNKHETDRLTEGQTERQTFSQSVSWSLQRPW